ncbi:MAG: threonylcarbamoyl-AMP synthase [Clostridia bacterium]|nr:threonylcarbamoyl-AMP synthase [Clostridia bacterium]
MNTLHLHSTPAEVKQAGELLRAGQLVAIPTETVYGLAANAYDADAVAGIFAAKGRPADNPLIVHIASPDELPPLCSAIPETAGRLIDAFWPGPLTLILPKSDAVPGIVSAGLPTVAVRCPSDETARAIIRAAGVPLAAPSANLSGSPSPTTAARVAADMDGRIAAIVDGGPCRVGVESTVVTLCTEVPRLLRLGGVTLEQLQAVLGEVEMDDAVTQPLKADAVAASPGMKYKHYAPTATVILVKGDAAAFCRYVNAHAADGVEALGFDGETADLQVPFQTYGRREDHQTQAHAVFEELRKADDRHVRTLYVACPDSAGVGLAVYNRLLRSAGFQVVTA